MKGTTIASAVVGLSMMSSGGWIASVGWVLFGASVLWIVFLQTVINKLKDELKFERNERELLSTRVGEMKVRMDKQQQALVKGATERLELSREIEGMRTSIALLVSSNEKNMATIGKLVDKYGDV